MRPNATLKAGPAIAVLLILVVAPVTAALDPNPVMVNRELRRCEDAEVATPNVEGFVDLCFKVETRSKADGYMDGGYSYDYDAEGGTDADTTLDAAVSAALRGDRRAALDAASSTEITVDPYAWAEASIEGEGEATARTVTEAIGRMKFHADADATVHLSFALDVDAEIDFKLTVAGRKLVERHIDASRGAVVDEDLNIHVPADEVVTIHILLQGNASLARASARTLEVDSDRVLDKAFEAIGM